MIDNVLEKYVIFAYRATKIIGVMIILIYFIIGFLQFFMENNIVVQDMEDLFTGILIVIVGKLGIENEELKSKEKGKRNAYNK